MIKLTIHGKPIPQQRPRLSKNGKVFSKQFKEKRFVQWQIKSQMNDQDAFKDRDASISVEIAFHMPIPSSWSQKRLKSVLGKPHHVKPDVDNLEKFYLDCMNKIVYPDDCQISQLYCKKIYSDKPRVMINISQINSGETHG